MEVGSGCNRSLGRFVLKELTLSSGVIQSFALDFEEHCNGADPSVYGAFRFNSAVDTTMFDGPYPVYALTFARPENGSISGGGLACDPAHVICRVEFEEPQDVTITATPAQGFIFAGWAGTCHGAATATVRANMLRHCGATFLPVVPAEPRTQLTLTSQPGHKIAPGRAEVFSSLNAVWRISGATGSNGVGVEITTLGDRGPERWEFAFNGATGAPLVPGGIWWPARVSGRHLR